MQLAVSLAVALQRCPCTQWTEATLLLHFEPRCDPSGCTLSRAPILNLTAGKRTAFGTEMFLWKWEERLSATYAADNVSLPAPCRAGPFCAYWSVHSMAATGSAQTLANQSMRSTINCF